MPLVSLHVTLQGRFVTDFNVALRTPEGSEICCCFMCLEVLLILGFGPEMFSTDHATETLVAANVLR
jgi:hypothetical protein